MALSMLRQLPFYKQQQTTAEWEHHPDMQELSGSTVLICGMGNLGRTVAEKFRLMGCRIMGIRKVIHDIPHGFEEVYNLRMMPGVIGKADIIISCLPVTRETAGVFNADVFMKMRPSALFFNIGSAAAVAEDDLIAALQNSIIAGAGLDVFEQEPLAPNSPLRAMENVLLTPRCAGISPLAVTRNYELFFGLLERYVTKKRLHNTIDFFTGY
jgi:phosphoglycerate dehydrogenase-like enzyme